MQPRRGTRRRRRPPCRTWRRRRRRRREGYGSAARSSGSPASSPARSAAALAIGTSRAARAARRFASWSSQGRGGASRRSGGRGESRWIQISTRRSGTGPAAASPVLFSYRHRSEAAAPVRSAAVRRAPGVGGWRRGRASGVDAYCARLAPSPRPHPASALRARAPWHTGAWACDVGSDGGRIGAPPAPS